MGLRVPKRGWQGSAGQRSPMLLNKSAASGGMMALGLDLAVHLGGLRGTERLDGRDEGAELIRQGAGREAHTRLTSRPTPTQPKVPADQWGGAGSRPEVFRHGNGGRGRGSGNGHSGISSISSAL